MTKEKFFLAGLVVIMFIAACQNTEKKADIAFNGNNVLANAEALLESGAQIQRISAIAELKEGEWNTLVDIEGPGMINHIWFTFPPTDTMLGRRNLIRIYWDGEEESSVEAPLTDFFGIPFGFTGSEFSINSKYLVVAKKNGLNCYFKMPFAKSAKIEIFPEQLESGGGFYIQADYYKYAEKLPDAYKNLRFHAQFRFENPCENYGKNYLFLDAKGKGFLLGATFGVQINEPQSDAWYHGGGDYIYIDGESNPSVLHGIGAEDFFGFSWGVEEFQSPYIGVPYREVVDGKIKKVAAYRFFDQDPIPFNNSIRGVLGAMANNHSSVAYWYQYEPHTPFFNTPKADNRMPESTAKYGTYDIEPDYAIQWKLLAPFKINEEQSFEKESEFEIKENGDEYFQYITHGQRPTQTDTIHVKWKKQRAYHNFIDFNTVGRPAIARIKLQSSVYGYALANIECDSDKEVTAWLGFDDQVRVRLNDEVVYNGKHEAGFEEISFPMKLKKGKNRILIKLSNYDNTNWKMWAFSFRYE